MSQFDDWGPWDLDLGHDHHLKFMGWHPDRTIEANRVRYEGIPDVDRWGASVWHRTPEGKECIGGITFAGDVQQQVSPRSVMWTVESWEPLTLSPSLLCRCGDHGFIRQGRWEPA